MERQHFVRHVSSHFERTQNNLLTFLILNTAKSVNNFLTKTFPICPHIFSLDQIRPLSGEDTKFGSEKGLVVGGQFQVSVQGMQVFSLLIHRLGFQNLLELYQAVAQDVLVNTHTGQDMILGNNHRELLLVVVGLNQRRGIPVR